MGAGPLLLSARHRWLQWLTRIAVAAVPFTYSTDGGASFAKGSTGKGFKLPFPALGGNQRPCVHRLLSGNLVFVGTHHPPPKAASMTT